MPKPPDNSQPGEQDAAGGENDAINDPGDAASPPDVAQEADTQSAGDTTLPSGHGLVIAPDAIEFGVVSIKVPSHLEDAERTVTVTNSGNSPVEVYKVSISGSVSFPVLLDPGTALVGEPHRYPTPKVLKPAEVWTFRVLFVPMDPSIEKATIKLTTNDPHSPEGGWVIPVRGEGAHGCLATTATSLNFGLVPAGQTKYLSLGCSSCGSAAVAIEDVRLSEGSSSAFALIFDQIPGFQGGSKPSWPKPWIVSKDKPDSLIVSYTPDGVSPVDGAGSPIPDNGVVSITVNTAQGKLEIPVSGLGAPAGCLMPTITAAEGAQVTPQTNLHLSGDADGTAVRDIAQWNWNVVQPEGSVSTFKSTAAPNEVTFEVNAPGSYLFSLALVDKSGNESCAPATLSVTVIPDHAIHVALLWDTPGDANQTDEGPDAGSDMDLHFAHPMALGPDQDKDGKPDGWFDLPFDCFWFNDHPNWGSKLATDDDPILDRDDTDGAGPEILNLNQPESGKSYRIGVHYFAENGFGPSTATVQVYINGELVYEAQQAKLKELDMWEVATVAWPSGKVTPATDADGNPKVTPNYKMPW